MQTPPATVAQSVRSGTRISTILRFLVLACLLPGVLASVLLLVHDYRILRQQLEHDLKGSARALSQAVDLKLTLATQVGQTLAASDALSRGDFRAFHVQAKHVIDTTQVGFAVVLMDPTAQQLLNTRQPFGSPLPKGGNSLAMEKALASGLPAISPLYTGGVLQQPVVSADVPVMVDGQLRYLLSVGLLPSQIDAILMDQQLPPSWVVSILDSEGRTVARSPDPSRFLGTRVSGEFWSMVLSADAGQDRRLSRDGVEVFAVWHRSPQTRWTVALGVPTETLEAGLRQTLAMLLGVVLTLIAVGFLLALWASEKIVGSVRALAAPALALRHAQVVAVPLIPIRETAEVAAAIADSARLLAARAAEIKDIQRIAGFASWTWNVVTRELRVSDSLQDICGRDITSPAQVRDLLLPPPAWDKLQLAVQATRRTGQPFELELEALHANGGQLWIEMHGQMESGQSGPKAELRGSVLDITRRKEAEMALLREQASQLKNLEREVAERTESLRMVNQKLQRLVRTDVLTQLHNRQAADERLRAEHLRMKRSAQHWAVMFIDIDHFKKVNDTHGHEVGDLVLKRLAEVLLRSVRATDAVARYGGEEFVVILPDTDQAGAEWLAEKVRSEVEGTPFAPVERVTVSIGVALSRLEDPDPDTVVRRADLALYRAKREGRNRVCVA